MEMSSVKPRMEVALKTGFRRLIYDKKRPPLEPQTRARSLSRHLRRPYVYTQDTLFSVPRTHRTRWSLRKPDAEPTYQPFEKPEVKKFKPRDSALQMAANFSTRSSAAILDHIHDLARQDYIGEGPSRCDDDLGRYVSDILNRAKTRPSGPKNYYVATEVSGVQADDGEEEGGYYTYNNGNNYDGYDVYLPVKTNSLYDEDDEYYFVPEPKNSRSRAPVTWGGVVKVTVSQNGVAHRQK
jgi:hypothetical protein